MKRIKVMPGELIFRFNRQVLKKVSKFILHNRDVAIISNNCCGADICHTYGLRFNSPTVNLQILPCDFPEFCENLEYYLNKEIIEIEHSTALLNEKQRESIKKVYGGRTIEELNEFPFGMCDDILIAFQHYSIFAVAKEEWDRRKERTNIDNCAFLFTVESGMLEDVHNFEMISRKNKAIITVNWDYTPIKSDTLCVRSGEVPPGGHFMDRHNLFIKHYELNFDSVKWLNRIKANV